MTPELVQQIQSRRVAAQARRALRRIGISDPPQPLVQLAAQPVGADGHVGDIAISTPSVEATIDADADVSELDAQISAEAAAVM